MAQKRILFPLVRLTSGHESTITDTGMVDNGQTKIAPLFEGGPKVGWWPIVPKPTDVPDRLKPKLEPAIRAFTANPEWRHLRAKVRDPLVQDWCRKQGLPAPGASTIKTALKAI